MIDYGKIRKPPKQVKDNVWVHETEVWFDKKNDHSNILIEEHRKTSVQTLLGDLVDARHSLKQLQSQSNKTRPL